MISFEQMANLDHEVKSSQNRARGQIFSNLNAKRNDVYVLRFLERCSLLRRIQSLNDIT